MTDAIKFILDSVGTIFGVLDNYSFSFFGVNVSLGTLLIGFILLSMAFGVLWKGARG